MTNTETQEIPIDHIVKGIVLIAGSAYEEDNEENLFVRKWAQANDLACGLAIAQQDGLAQLSPTGEELLRKSLSLLAEAIGVSDSRLVDIAFDIDQEIELT
jgi:hypothetical protein